MNKLKTFRETHKISQKDLAILLDTTQQQISLYETNQRELKESQIETILNQYKAEMGELLEAGDYKMSNGEKVLEIGKYIEGNNRIVTALEILEKFGNTETYKKLTTADKELVTLMIEEHNKRYE